MPTMTPTRATKKRKPGRPPAPTGIRKDYQQISFYLPPTLVEALDRKAAAEAARTGLPVHRTDLIRRVLTAYVQEEA
jgi:hypothetical protein